MLDFTTRSIKEFALRVLWITEAQRKGYAFLDGQGFDLDALPGADGKAYRGTRDPADIDTGMTHVTGVGPGFGVARYQKARFRKPGSIPSEIVEQLKLAGVAESDWPYLVALMQRFRYAPYQEVGTQSGYVFRNRRLSQASWHGNGGRHSGGNQGWGCAFDCSPNTKLDDFAIATFQAALRDVHLRWLKAKRTQAISMGEDLNVVYPIRIIAHAQTKHPGRANDPGEQIYKRVVIPVVESTAGMFIDPEYHWGTGRPLKKHWYQ